MQLGPYTLPNNVILAPMAGVTDLPFRQLCRRLGAGLVVGEMISANPRLRQTRKTQLRMKHDGEPEPRSVQIAGSCPTELAQCAQFNVENGAQIIDINMGCPAKKVCNKAAGSALLADEPLVARILSAVVEAVDVPVTLKIRTGICRDTKNALHIARLAEDAGITALAVHGRTRSDMYKGEAEYDTIASIKASIGIPVIANGDITTPEKAQYVLHRTNADAIMVGRAAQGRPWIFREIAHFLTTDQHLPPPSASLVAEILLEHCQQLYDFYDEFMGVRIARKHVAWYCQASEGALDFRKRFNALDSAESQLAAIRTFFLV